MIRKIHYCISWRARLMGMLPQRHSNQDYYVFIPCSTIHTVGMAFAIDVIFCTKTAEVLRYVHCIKPNRIVSRPGAFFVIEFASQMALSNDDVERIVRHCLGEPEQRKWR